METWSDLDTMDRGRARLEASRKRAAAAQPLGGAAVQSGLDNLLAAMGSKRAATTLAAAAVPAARREPRTTGVGEEVWDSTMIQSPRPDKEAPIPPSLAIELMRAAALRRMQAAAEAELLRILGPAVLGKL